MRKYLLYGHGGSENHGCEALVRTTISLLNKNKEHIVLSSYNPQQDYKYNIHNICCIKRRGEKKYPFRFHPRFLKSYYDLTVNKNGLALDALYETYALEVSKGDVAISIGGDNYCYGGVESLFLENEVYRAAKLKTVLWGCSIEPELLETNSRLVEDLKRFDLITARETLSYNAIKKINQNTELVCDSAFLLKAKECVLPHEFTDCDLVGINSSPLIEAVGRDAGFVRKSYSNLIRKILKETEMKILLIPHVVCDTTDDRSVLKALLEEFKDTDRIYLVEDGTCEEIKGYIAKCRFFVGARTHATIAAYSSYVPTLVVGYSVKSKGIAEDLFGTHENYVVPVQNLCAEDDLASAFDFLLDNEQHIKTILMNTMPTYINRINNGVQKLNQL